MPFFLSLDTQFRMSILERLEQMEQRMAEITNQNPSSETIATKGGGMEGGAGATDQPSQVNPILYCLNFTFILFITCIPYDSEHKFFKSLLHHAMIL